MIYVNDISDSLLSLTKLFGDDSSLFYSSASLEDIQGIINHDLRILTAWAKQWLITFNPRKTEAVLFTLKLFENFPNLFFSDTEIKFVQGQTLRTLSSNGQWHTHIKNIIASATKVTGIRRKLKYSFHRIALNQIYMSQVLPVLEYFCTVWDGCTVQGCLALERLQNEAARIVTGLTRLVLLENLYRECGWRPLSERRMKNKLVFMYNVVNESVPSYISDLIPPLVRETTQYPLRNNNNIMLPFARTEISRRSCIPSSISLWNSLEHDFREAQNVNAFKYQLKKHKFSTSQVPLYYFDGERYFQ